MDDDRSHLETLAAALAPLPDSALVPVSFLRRQLGGDNGSAAPSPDLLNVAGIAEVLGRSKSTARQLCSSGAIPNVFRLNGREWRCRRSDVIAFLDSQRVSHGAGERVEPVASRPRRRGAADLCAWRRVAAENDA